MTTTATISPSERRADALEMLGTRTDGDGCVLHVCPACERGKHKEDFCVRLISEADPGKGDVALCRPCNFRWDRRKNRTFGSFCKTRRREAGQ